MNTHSKFAQPQPQPHQWLMITSLPLLPSSGSDRWCVWLFTAESRIFYSQQKPGLKFYEASSRACDVEGDFILRGYGLDFVGARCMCSLIHQRKKFVLKCVAGSLNTPWQILAYMIPLWRTKQGEIKRKRMRLVNVSCLRSSCLTKYLSPNHFFNTPFSPQPSLLS